MVLIDKTGNSKFLLPIEQILVQEVQRLPANRIYCGSPEYEGRERFLTQRGKNRITGLLQELAFREKNIEEYLSKLNYLEGKCIHPNTLTPESHKRDLWGVTSIRGNKSIYYQKISKTGRANTFFPNFITLQEYFSPEFRANVHVRVGTMQYSHTVAFIRAVPVLNDSSVQFMKSQGIYHALFGEKAPMADVKNLKKSHMID